MKADTITKDYVRNPDIFADIFNFYIYGGRQVIRPEELTERDSTKIALPYGDDGALVPVQKYRDALKLYTAMVDGRAAYYLFGVENQSDVHYAMPVKNNLYDSLEYAGQVEEAARSHRLRRRKKDGKVKPTSGEFLSGFWKTDRLIPSVTVTIYFGADDWDGPLSLFEMMDVSDPELLACMDNYHVHLIAPALMSDADIMKFQSSLREVMFFIKYSKDKDALRQILAANEQRFQSLERRAADVIKAITNFNIEYDDGEENVNMCQALQDLCTESRAEGLAEGIAKGMAKGKEEGITIGESKKARQIAQNLYSMGIEIEKIAQGVGCAAETVAQWLGLENPTN